MQAAEAAKGARACARRWIRADKVQKQEGGAGVRRASVETEPQMRIGVAEGREGCIRAVTLAGQS